MSADLPLYGVLGLGRSGMGALRFLIQQGHPVIAWDDREDARQSAKDTFEDAVQIQPVEDWKEVQKVILSPGIPPDHGAVQKLRSEGISCGTEVDLFLDQHAHSKIIGVTGTNGKSTLVALMDHVLKTAGIPVASGGNLGTPCVELPDLPEEGVYILELSSYQLHWLNVYPFLMSCITNITPDHLEWHGDWDSYVQAKIRICEGAKRVVLGADNKDRPWHERVPDNKEKTVVSSPKIEDLARACLASFNLDEQTWREALKTFKALPHRQEIIPGPGGSFVVWVNDSKATNVPAVKVALDAYKDHRIFWIAGGQAKKGDDWGSVVPEGVHPQGVFLYGKCKTLKVALENVAPFVGYYDTLEEATESAWKQVQEVQVTSQKSVVLFSPGCASFDQFKNFEERGDVFRRCVQSLSQRGRLGKQRA
ncbi:MAG: UDP-N-acetylmuramoyl-L-alanine--D-glutamate ligase [bacterium]|nr:UDP-N-acetylmuramoyl-L-alanine--D-glutamate ligase [bacterium]